MGSKKPLHRRSGGHEVLGERGKQGLSDDDEEPKPGTQDGVALVRAPADAPVVRACDPATNGDLRNPLFVANGVMKVVVVKLDAEARTAQDAGEDIPEVAIRKEHRRSVGATRRARRSRPRSPLRW